MSITATFNNGSGITASFGSGVATQAATQTEVNTGTETGKFVSPATLKNTTSIAQFKTRTLAETVAINLGGQTLAFGIDEDGDDALYLFDYNSTRHQILCNKNGVYIYTNSSAQYLSLDSGGVTIKGVKDPAADQDAVNKQSIIKALGSLVDGASIAVNCQLFPQTQASLTTTQSAIAYVLSNFGKVHDLSVKKNIAGTCAITFSGTGLVFVDMNNAPDTESASLQIDHDGGNGGHAEYNLKDSGITTGGNRIIYITKL